MTPGLTPGRDTRDRFAPVRPGMLRFVSVREVEDHDESLDPYIVLAILVLTAIMATGVVFAVLVTAVG